MATEVCLPLLHLPLDPSPPPTKNELSKLCSKDSEAIAVLATITMTASSQPRSWRVDNAMLLQEKPEVVGKKAFIQ